METLMGVSMLLSVLLKLHPVTSLIQGSTTASESVVLSLKDPAPLDDNPFFFRPWGMQTWEITEKSKEKQDPDPLLPATGSCCM